MDKNTERLALAIAASNVSNLKSNHQNMLRTMAQMKIDIQAMEDAIAGDE